MFNAVTSDSASERATDSSRPPGGLGVEQDGPDFFWNVRLIADQAFGKFTVVLEAAGNEAATDAIHGPGKQRHLHPPAIELLDSHLPDVKQALIHAGCITFDPLATMPPTITDRARREGDERFTTITGRRPTVEYAVASVAENLLPIRRGVSVASLLNGPSATKGIPHVTGVRTIDGEEVSADLVIDATGRASKLPDWLAAIGARRPIEEAEDAGFIYYSRYFRAKNGVVPPYRTGIHTYFHSFELLTLPGDAGIWSMTVFTSAGDQALKRLRDPKHWTALVSACPLHSGSTVSRSPAYFLWGA